MVQPVLLSPDEVAELLRVKRAYVYGLLRRGWLPTVHVGRFLRVPAESVTDFVAKGGHRP